MKRNLGSMTGFLAILAIALHTTFPTAQESGGTTSTFTQKKSGAKKGGGGKDGDSDEPPEGPWLATRAYFRDFRGPLPQREDPRLDNLPSLRTAIPDTQAKEIRALFGVRDEAQIYSVVASVPDPLHTRLALFFDETIDAIERGAEHQGWIFSQQWLPWLDPANGSEDDISERRHQRRLLRQQEAFPGVLVFRCGNPLLCGSPSMPVDNLVLLVFLVPDSPTSGIAGDTFSTALNLASVLPPPRGRRTKSDCWPPAFQVHSNL